MVNIFSYRTPDNNFFKEKLLSIDDNNINCSFIIKLYDIINTYFVRDENLLSIIVGFGNILKINGIDSDTKYNSKSKQIIITKNLKKILNNEYIINNKNLCYCYSTNDNGTPRNFSLSNPRIFYDLSIIFNNINY